MRDVRTVWQLAERHLVLELQGTGVDVLSLMVRFKDFANDTKAFGTRRRDMPYDSPTEAEE